MVAGAAVAFVVMAVIVQAPRGVSGTG
jgi:hypothetical protein